MNGRPRARRSRESRSSPDGDRKELPRSPCHGPQGEWSPPASGRGNADPQGHRKEFGPPNAELRLPVKWPGEAGRGARLSDRRLGRSATHGFMGEPEGRRLELPGNTPLCLRSRPPTRPPARQTGPSGEGPEPDSRCPRAPSSWRAQRSCPPAPPGVKRPPPSRRSRSRRPVRRSTWAPSPAPWSPRSRSTFRTKSSSCCAAACRCRPSCSPTLRPTCRSPSRTATAARWSPRSRS